MYVQINNWTAGSAGEKGAEAICQFDSASDALKTDELTVGIKPSGLVGHLKMKENKKVLVSQYDFY